MNFTCPCCGYRILCNKDEYDICPICFWEVDHYQEQNPNSPEGANHIFLLEGQIYYRRFGACDNTCILHGMIVIDTINIVFKINQCEPYHV